MVGALHLANYHKQRFMRSVDMCCCTFKCIFRVFCVGNSCLSSCHAGWHTGSLHSDLRVFLYLIGLLRALWRTFRLSCIALLSRWVITFLGCSQGHSTRCSESFMCLEVMLGQFSSVSLLIFSFLIPNFFFFSVSFPVPFVFPFPFLFSSLFFSLFFSFVFSFFFPFAFPVLFPFSVPFFGPFFYLYMYFLLDITFLILHFCHYYFDHLIFVFLACRAFGKKKINRES